MGTHESDESDTALKVLCEVGDRLAVPSLHLLQFRVDPLHKRLCLNLDPVCLCDALCRSGGRVDVMSASECDGFVGQWTDGQSC